MMSFVQVKSTLLIFTCQIMPFKSPNPDPSHSSNHRDILIPCLSFIPCQLCHPTASSESARAGKWDSVPADTAQMTLGVIDVVPRMQPPAVIDENDAPLGQLLSNEVQRRLGLDLSTPQRALQLAKRCRRLAAQWRQDVFPEPHNSGPRTLPATTGSTTTTGISAQQDASQDVPLGWVLDELGGMLIRYSGLTSAARVAGERRPLSLSTFMMDRVPPP
uniref:Uncharacterized protein n=1 Tax=Bionectria ochroleuca TaxID=29856 RepID=A0A8H7K289_BIOOC